MASMYLMANKQTSNQALTCDSITDDQILALRHDIERLTAEALGEDGLTPNHPLMRKARARCAEILNTRIK